MSGHTLSVLALCVALLAQFWSAGVATGQFLRKEQSALAQRSWLALAIAASFATYSFLRKKAAVNSVLALWTETLVLSLPALWAVSYTPAHPNWALLALSGPLTGIPLLWFGIAARHLRLVTLGLLQYISPTFQFLVAVVAFHEPFEHHHAVAFALIWSAVGLYSLAATRRGGQGAG